MEDVVIDVKPLGFPWETLDPFLFCAHHDDHYPEGDDRMGPAASLAGRDIGQDFDPENAWRMYHGDVVPGFPRHPHRGFETVTLARRGFIDHADSLGATARFGGGDVQWMTAGRGIVHSEMFPLRDPKNPNPLELFQIWLNLPREDKLADPHFTMLWSHTIPKITTAAESGAPTVVTLIAGRLGGAAAPPPPPRSWASRKESDVCIALLRMARRATFTLPRANEGTNRAIYVFEGGAIRVAGRDVPLRSRAVLRGERDAEIVNGDDETEILLLQGRPIAEPVAHYGPFVMNTRAELQQAFIEFQRTEFGGWPWPSDGPVHARSEGRFAKHADGKIERVPTESER